MILNGTTESTYRQYKITHCTMKLGYNRHNWRVGKSSMEVVLFYEGDTLVRSFPAIIYDYQEDW